MNILTAFQEWLAEPVDTTVSATISGIVLMIIGITS
jgi:hypothetical protein